jgi:hypothetical protein
MASSPTTVVAGTPFVATFDDPGGLAYFGARVEVPVTRAIVSYWREASLIGSVWTVTLDGPPTPGYFLLVWRTGDPEPPAYEALLPLVSVDSIAVVEDVPLTGVYPLVSRGDVTPTVDEVAAFERTRLVAEGSSVAATFTAETSPTAAQVEGLIQQAIDLVLPELPTRMPVAHYEGVQRAIALYTAILIEGSHFREQQDSSGSSGLWRSMYSTAIIALRNNIEKDLAQARLIGTFEPRISTSLIA